MLEAMAFAWEVSCAGQEHLHSVEKLIKEVADAKRYSKWHRMRIAMLLTAWGY